MFFAIQGTIWTVAISATSRDASHAVVEGYDEQALSWDEVKAARQHSMELGWQTKIFVDRAGDIHGNRGLTLQVTDRNGRPVTNADLQLRAFHRAAAGVPQQIKLNEVGPGSYHSSIRIDRAGKWRFSGSATIQESTHLIDQTLEISKQAG